MSDDVFCSDEPCPNCGYEPTLYQYCDVIGCADGFIHMHEYDDPLWYDEGEFEMCSECEGRGIVCWCSKCGNDIIRNREGAECE